MRSFQEELARVHKEIQEINNTLKHCHIVGDGESVIVYQDILNVIDTLETLETRLHTLYTHSEALEPQKESVVSQVLEAEKEPVSQKSQIRTSTICAFCGVFSARRARDLDKILRTGIFRIFRVDEYAKILKQYTTANSTTAEGIESITWGSWKVFEKFETKKALMNRVKELEQEPDVIFDGR